MEKAEPLPSSYRDPSGFMFKKDGVYYRQINRIFKDEFDYFISSGCYKELVNQGLLLPHETLSENLTGSPDWYLTLKPEQLKFVSYPYEWSFDMLKDAALLTLRILKTALEKGMILKDATPYNIQFHKGKMFFIDTLSFEKYNEKEPWVAYRQFCETFLGPLLISKYAGQSLNQLFLTWPDGIPLPVIKALLPARSKWSLHLWLHIHLHENIRHRSKSKNTTKRNLNFSKHKLERLIQSLELIVKKLTLKATKTNWNEYYNEASERGNYIQSKQAIIAAWLKELPEVNIAADLGANEGLFSKLVVNEKTYTVAADADEDCINRLYLAASHDKNELIHPVIINVTNPSPAIGILNNERPSFIERGPFDLVLALALIHHLAIAKNIPLLKLAVFLDRICLQYLIIEFIPKEDNKLQLLMRNRKDIFNNYTEGFFEIAFANFFKLVKKEKITDSGRTLYLMKKIDSP
jgi:2-polyprenyl-3-methyl-5-hydroxy-6-metoxy-1,4-benzoquinol methylase